MEKENYRIYQILTNKDGLLPTLKSLYRNPIEKYTLCIFIILLILFFIFIFLPFEATKKWSIWVLIALAIVYMVYILASFVTKIKFILSPVKSYISNLIKELESEEEILQSLTKEDVADLKAVKSRLEFEREQLRSRMGFLLGTIDKLGIIPAAFALYVVYAKAVNENLLPSIPGPILVFFVGLYLGAFLVKHMTDRFSNMILLIEQAIKEAEKGAIITTISESSTQIDHKKPL